MVFHFRQYRVIAVRYLYPMAPSPLACRAALAAALSAIAVALPGAERRLGLELQRGETVRFLRRDRFSCAAVVESRQGRRLVIDGKTVAASDDGLRLPALLAQLPLMLAGRPKSVLVLGWGSGVATASALSHSIEKLDAVERSPAVLAAAAAFGAGEVLVGDRRLRLVVAEPSSALIAPGALYDVIVIEGGAAQGDGCELYQLAARRLRPGGLAAARLRLGDSENQRRQVLLFLSAFPHATAWSVGADDALLVGGRRPASLAPLEHRFSRAGPSLWLRPLGLSYPATLLSLQVAGEKALRDFARLRRASAGQGLFAFDQRPWRRDREGLLLSRYLASRRGWLRPREYLEIMLHPRAEAERHVFRGVLDEWVSKFPDDPRAVGFLYLTEEREGRVERAAQLRSRLSSLNGKRRSRRAIVIPSVR